VDYLDVHEMEKLLGNIDQNSSDGRRDHTLFSLMLNTGARVQEILNLRVSDIRLEAPHLVRLVGKGNKVRVCPIWPRTAKRLVALIATLPTDDGDAGQRHLFRNRAGAPLTRFGVRYLLRKHLPKRTSAAAAGSERQVHPHLLRHTTAVCLLKSGVDFAMISQWLGHSSLKVTMRYAKADLDLKRQVLAQVFPHALGAPPAGRLRIVGSELTGWLRNL
jgi:integrase/recombinase XerD